VVIDSANAHQPVTAAEPAGQRRIWLCADDYGVSPAVNAAIRDLVLGGRINASSVMVVAPSLTRSEARSLAMLNAGGRRVAIGLHLTLTAPYQPLTRNFAPRQDDAFPPRNDLVRAALLRRLDEGEIDAEVKAQVAAFAAAFGQAPDFIDGHLHVHLLPQVRDAVLAAATEAGPQVWVRQCGSTAGLLQQLSDPKGILLDWLSRGFRRRAGAAGVPTNSAFAGTYTYGADADFAALFPQFLVAMPDAGLIMCHPGRVDAELERLEPLTALREREYDYLAGEAFPRVLAEHGVALA